MADRFRTTFPVPVTFNDGELPTASKLNGLERQSRQGQSIIGYALGDLWNQAGDSLLTSGAVDDIANMIPNIARYLGPSHRLNPRIPYLPDIEKYTHAFTNDAAAGVYEVQLPFPSAGGTYTWTGTGAPTNRETTITAVNANGDWYIDEATGYCYFYENVVADWTLTYTPIVAGDLGDVDAIGGGTYGTTPQWNQIPDPDTNPAYNFQGLKIQYVNADGVGGGDNSEGYYIFLPPRMPLNTRRLDHSPQHTNGSPSNSANQQAAPSAGDKLFWQTDTVTGVTGVNAEHYRYLLPSIITDHWSQSSTIPAGLLCFYDYSQTKTIVEGITFTAENAATPRKYVVVASGTAFDNWITTYGPSLGFTDTVLKQTDHAAVSNYKAGVRMLCAGTDLSTVVSMLVQRLYDHDHSTASSMTTKMLSHGDLLDHYDSFDEGIIDLNIELLFLGNPIDQLLRLVRSNWADDDHSQYLHRGGTYAYSGTARDRYNNSMLGDLLMASTNYTSHYQNTSGDSRKILFGDKTNGPQIGYDASADVLRLSNKDVAADVFKPIPTEVSPWGYSGIAESAGHGAIRKWLIMPQEFYIYRTTSTTEPCLPTNYSDWGWRLYDYNGTYQAHETQALYMASPSTVGENQIAIAYLPIPFAKYCIVDVALSCYPTTPTGSWTAPVNLANYCFCDLGFSRTQSGITGTPDGNTSDRVDLYSKFVGTVSTTFPVPQRVMSANTTIPLVSIDATTTDVSRPWIRFCCYDGALYNFYIRDIMIYYRVKEF